MMDWRFSRSRGTLLMCSGELRIKREDLKSFGQNNILRTCLLFILITFSFVLLIFPTWFKTGTSGGLWLI